MSLSKEKVAKYNEFVQALEALCKEHDVEIGVTHSMELGIGDLLDRRHPLRGVQISYDDD